MLKEYGCLPVPDGMKCPCCDWNRYNGSRGVIERKLSKHMEKIHLISNNNHALNMLLNIYGMDWWMDFTFNQEIVDVNFHQKDLGYCKISICGAVERNIENYNSHVHWCMFRQDVGECEPFWELLKMNLIQNQEVNLMKYRIRSNTLRIEEDTGRVSFTNNQNDIELYLRRTVKGKETLLGELRIRENDDELPKERFSRKIITLKDAEIILSAGKSYKEQVNTRKTQEKHMTVDRRER
jgi:hypothetical protein